METVAVLQELSTPRLVAAKEASDEYFGSGLGSGKNGELHELEEQPKRHELWRIPINGRNTLIPRHDQQAGPAGILAGILRDLGLEHEQLHG